MTRKIIHQGVVLTCTHMPADVTGFCPACQADFDAEPLEYLEFGYHAAGEQRFAELQAELAAMPPGEVADEEIPY